MASSFETLRIDGTDYRQRAIDGHAVVLDAATYAHELQDAAARGTVSDDDFSGLIRHLASVHPSRYIRVIDGISTIGLRDVVQLEDQSAALRFVAFVDRAYDAQIPMRATGRPLDEVFAEMLGGGYRKKYLRAISRLNALTHS
jgi:cell division protein ZapE